MVNKNFGVTITIEISDTYIAGNNKKACALAERSNESLLEVINAWCEVHHREVSTSTAAEQQEMR